MYPAIRRAAGLRFMAAIIASTGAIGAGHAIAEVGDLSAKLKFNTEVRFYAEDGVVKKVWEDALADGSITTQTYKVQQDDTLGKIFARQGLRTDQNSVDLVNALNGYRLAPKNLTPGDDITILSRGTSGKVPAHKSWGIVIAADKKADLDEQYMTLRDWGGKLAEWTGQPGSASETAQTKKLYRQIMEGMGELRTSWYATDPASLDGLNDAMADVNGKFSAISYDPSWHLADKDLDDLAVINNEVIHQVWFMRNYDQPKVPVEVVTRSAVSGEEVPGLSVCYRKGAHYERYKKINNAPKPDWECSSSFDSLSSPARNAFYRNAGFVIWVERGGRQVSDYHILDIEPNQKDGRFVKEVLVDEPRQ